MSHTFAILINPATNDFDAIYVPPAIDAAQRKQWVTAEFGSIIDDSYPMRFQQSKDSDTALATMKYAERSLRTETAQWQERHNTQPPSPL